MRARDDVSIEKCCLTRGSITYGLHCPLSYTSLCLFKVTSRYEKHSLLTCNNRNLTVSQHKHIQDRLSSMHQLLCMNHVHACFFLQPVSRAADIPDQWTKHRLVICLVPNLYLPQRQGQVCTTSNSSQHKKSYQ